MSLSDLSFHAAEAFVRATQQARTPPRKKQPPASAGTKGDRLYDRAQPRGRRLGTTVANELSRRLNWPVYDHELLEELAKDLGVEHAAARGSRRKTGKLVAGGRRSVRRRSNRKPRRPTFATCSRRFCPWPSVASV